MQDRYFGDVGDFGKYGLLRTLTGVYPAGDRLRLSVVWYLTNDESHNNDGKHLGYLGRPGFEECDPELYGRLKTISQVQRAVDNAIELGILGRDTSFVRTRLALQSLPASQRAAARQQWFEAALVSAADADLVFCDPDNGITEHQRLLSSGKGAKFVGIDEVAAFHERGQSVVVYHHADRSGPVAAQAERRANQLKQGVGTDDVLALCFRRWSVRLFFILPSRRHSKLLRERTDRFLETQWSAHFDVAFDSVRAFGE